MSIDWNKPLRTIPSGHPATTHKIGWKRVISWDNNVLMVDEWGRQLHALVQHGPDSPQVRAGTQVVENVPEEPKDHVTLYRRDGTWVLDADHGIGLLHTKSQAERYVRTWGDTALAVKVPV